ncbi:MAG: LSM domain-containing protein [Nanoarchaeota archaeon]
MIMDEGARPLDTLNLSRNKAVIVELKNGYRYVGKLKAFDIHINIVLENADEYHNGEVKRKLGTVFIRGDTITILSPS